MYVAVTAAMTLPGRQVLAVVGALTAAAVVLPEVVPGWESLDSFVPQLLLAAFAAYGVGQVLKRNLELAQARLRALGYLPADWSERRRYDLALLRAVFRFQVDRGSGGRAVGTIGPWTRAELDEALRETRRHWRRGV